MALIPIRAGADTIGLLHLADRRKTGCLRRRWIFWSGWAPYWGVGIRRALAEEELRGQRERFQVTLSSIGDAVSPATLRPDHLHECRRGKADRMGPQGSVAETGKRCVNIINESTRQELRILSRRCSKAGKSWDLPTIRPSSERTPRKSIDDSEPDKRPARQYRRRGTRFP